MFLLLLCLLCFGVDSICSKTPYTDVFDFEICPQEKEANNDKGRVAFNVAGFIRNHEKLIKIPITIPYCMDLTIVRVTVDNPVAPPFVALDRDLMMVTIKYRLKQDSESIYLVTAKGVPLKDCNK